MRPWTTRRRAGLAAAALLALAGCRQPEDGRWTRARGAYLALVEKGEGPRAPAFDAVLEDLDQVPASSPHAAEARRLARVIRDGRGPPLRTPLAMVPTPGTRPPELEAQLAVCARLAARLGQDGGVGDAGREGLEDCRRRAERLDVHFAHGDDEDGGLHP